MLLTRTASPEVLPPLELTFVNVSTRLPRFFVDISSNVKII